MESATDGGSEVDVRKGGPGGFSLVVNTRVCAPDGIVCCPSDTLCMGELGTDPRAQVYAASHLDAVNIVYVLMETSRLRWTFIEFENDTCA